MNCSMTRGVIAVAMLACLHVAGVEAGKRQELEVITGAIDTRRLAGVVLLNDCGAMRGVGVEEWTEGWSHAKARVATSPNGTFELPNAETRGLRYLKFQAAGFNTVKVTVRVSSLSDDPLLVVSLRPAA